MPRAEFLHPMRPQPIEAPQKGAGGGTHQNRRDRRAARKSQTPTTDSSPVLSRRALIGGGAAAGALALMFAGAALDRPSSEQPTSVKDSNVAPLREPNINLAASAGQKIVLPGGGEVVRVFQPEDLVRSKVKEIVEKENKDEILKAVYLGGQHPTIDSIFTLPVSIGVTRVPGVTASTSFANKEFDENRIFTFGGQSNWNVVKKIHPRISFSEKWMRMQSDTAKEFIMIKEALHLNIMTTMARTFLEAQRRHYGLETHTVPITEREKEQTVMTIMGTNLDIQNTLLLDFAAYLFMIPQYEKFKAADPVFAEDMKDDMINNLIAEAQKRGIEYNKPNMDSQALYMLAFDNNSPWRNMVLEPQFADPIKKAIYPTPAQANR